MTKCVSGALAGAIVLWTSVALAQDKPSDYPTRPVRVIVAVSAGAGADTIARAAAQIMTERLGQNAMVDNRPGGSGVVATELVARSAADGYTLLSYADALLMLGVTKRVPFDVLKAFDPIVTTTSQPYVLVIQPSLPITNLKELVAYSQKVTLTYGSSGIAGTVHLGMERLAQATGAKLLHVPFKGTAPSLVAVMGGEIHMVAGSSIAAFTAARTGKVRALATLGLTRIPTLPDLPTLAEQGLPDYSLTNSYRMYAPAGTPRSIVMAINRVVGDGMHTPAMAQRLATEGAQPGERSTPEEIRTEIARDYARYAQQVKQLNVKLN